METNNHPEHNKLDPDEKTDNELTQDSEDDIFPEVSPTFFSSSPKIPDKIIVLCDDWFIDF